MLSFSTHRTVTVSDPVLPASQLSAIDGRENRSEIYTYALDSPTQLSVPMLDQCAANLDLNAMVGKEVHQKSDFRIFQNDTSVSGTFTSIGD